MRIKRSYSFEIKCACSFALILCVCVRAKLSPLCPHSLVVVAGSLVALNALGFCDQCVALPPVVIATVARNAPWCAMPERIVVAATISSSILRANTREPPIQGLHTSFPKTHLYFLPTFVILSVNIIIPPPLLLPPSSQLCTMRSEATERIDPPPISTCEVVATNLRSFPKAIT